MPSFYRCENEFGDPCTFAKENRKIPAGEVKTSMDGSGPKCPGKTLSGKDCGCELIPLGKVKKTSSDGNWKGILIVAGGILAAVAIIWFVIIPMFSGGAAPSISVQPGTLTFPQPTDGAASGSIQISNQGEGELIVTKIQASPPFTTTKNELQIKPDESATLFINFSSSSTESVKGKLTLQTNDPEKSSVIISLVVNEGGSKDPWWIYQQLETSSKILRTEP
ncbi:hypothetical protein KKHLCK_13205 [Candidatus Electrothrix laxa]